MPSPDQTSQTATEIDVDRGCATPEFVDFHGLRRLFGIPRSTAYELIDAGEIRSVSLRKKGRAKGRRLIDCQSVRAMFARCADCNNDRSVEVGRSRQDTANGSPGR